MSHASFCFGFSLLWGVEKKVLRWNVRMLRIKKKKKKNLASTWSGHCNIAESEVTCLNSFVSWGYNDHNQLARYPGQGNFSVSREDWTAIVDVNLNCSEPKTSWCYKVCCFLSRLSLDLILLSKTLNWYGGCGKTDSNSQGMYALGGMIMPPVPDK